MATLNLSQIPSTITTVEQLHVWSASILTEMVGGALYNELPSSINDTGVRAVAISDDFTDAQRRRRRLSRISILMNTAVFSGTLPAYLYAEEIALGDVPADYLEV